METGPGPRNGKAESDVVDVVKDLGSTDARGVELGPWGTSEATPEDTVPGEASIDELKISDEVGTNGNVQLEVSSRITRRTSALYLIWSSSRASISPRA